MQTNFMILMNRSIVLAQILSNGIMKENFDYNYLGIEALMACYNECDYYVDQQNEYFWKNIGVVRDFLAENMPEVKMIDQKELTCCGLISVHGIWNRMI